MTEINKIYNQNCLDGMHDLWDESCDVAITSPPYKDEDNYDIWKIGEIFQELYRVLKPKSLFFLNFGHLADFKSRPFIAASMAQLAGFKWNDTIVWKKTQFSPVQGKKRLNNLTEFIFLFYKENMPDLNRLSIGVPYKDKSNIGRYSDKDLRCGGNFWEFGYETVNSKEQKLHNDRFPLELPTRCIKLSGLPEKSLVIDPFSGSGTSALAAKSLGMNYIGYEINKNHYHTSIKRLGLI